MAVNLSKAVQLPSWCWLQQLMLRDSGRVV